MINIFYGSDDSGALNFFKQLFVNCEFNINQYKSKNELVEYLNTRTLKKDLIVLTGSAIGNKTLDKEAILICRDMNIKCFSFIEHWSWYKKRFLAYDNLLLPDQIFVNDRFALKKAIQEGLPKNKLKALGNPIFESLNEMNLDLNVERRESILKKYALPNNKKNIIFISENLKKDFRSNDFDELGFDEYEVLGLIKSFIKKNDEYKLIIKSHPSEKKFKYGYPKDPIYYLNKISINDLSIIGDCIIGMGSILMLELAMLNNFIYSCRPNSKQEFIGDLLGITINITNLNEIGKKSPNLKSLTAFRKSHIGSRKRIIDFFQKVKT